MRRQPAHQFRQQGRRALRIEILRLVGAEERRDGAGDLYARIFVRGCSGKRSGQFDQPPSITGETLFADVERNDGIAVRSDDPGTGLDEFDMCLLDDFRRFHQCQRGPFRLPERRAKTFKLTRETAVKNGDIFRHSRGPFIGLSWPGIPPRICQASAAQLLS